MSSPAREEIKRRELEERVYAALLDLSYMLVQDPEGWVEPAELYEHFTLREKRSAFKLAAAVNELVRRGLIETSTRPTWDRQGLATCLRPIFSEARLRSHPRRRLHPLADLAESPSQG